MTEPVTETTEVIVEETVEDGRIDIPITYPEVKYEEPITYYEAVDQRDAILFYIDELNTAIASGKYTFDAMYVMVEEMTRLEQDALLLLVDISKFQSWMNQYPYATEVWFRLRSEGMSPAAVAGILGNMMAETGGGTLNFRPGAYDGSGCFYGICQWSTYYYPQVNGADFDYQVNFLIETMPKEYKNFGFAYQRGFTLEDFYNMESPEAAAMAFAKIYERCGSSSYSWRQHGARVAYDYFMGGND